jgi:hypothetical protein
MRRTALQYLDDILEAIGNIEEDTAGISFDEFDADRRRKAAVIRNFEVIGEAVKTFRTVSKISIPTPTGRRLQDSGMYSLTGFLASNPRFSGTMRFTIFQG